MRVYVAGPIMHGDTLQHIRRAIDEADTLLEAGHSPYLPHTQSALWHMVHPHSHEEWMRLDLSWLVLCDALVWLPGQSPGTDLERRWAELYQIPTYPSAAAFLATDPRIGVTA